MQQVERKYLKNILNADDADFSVGQDEVINSENVRFGSTDAGVINTIESIGSNTLLSMVQPSVTFVQIGAVADSANRRFFYFLKDLYGPWDKIVCYDVESESFYNVLFSAQVTGGLNFDKDHVIHSGAIVNGLLYWTDFLNQPRRINVEAAINLNQPGTFPDVVAYTSPMTAPSLTVIRKPPVYPLALDKILDPTIKTNQVKNNAFRFAYQYIYRDGEISTISPHSLLAPYNYPDEDFNSIQVTIPLIEKPDQDTKIVRVIVIYVDGNAGFVIKTWNKANAAQAQEIAEHVAGLNPLTFDFSNDAVGEAIDAAMLAKPYDSVPLLSETLEQGTNRLFLGRNIIGYDTPTQTSLAAAIFQQDSEGGVEGIWLVVLYANSEVTYDVYMAWFAVPVDGTHPAGLYMFDNDPIHYPAPGLVPPEIDIDDYTWIADPTQPGADFTVAQIIAAAVGYPGEGTVGFLFDSPDNTPVTTSNTIVGGDVQILKSDSPYRLGIVFYDEYLRQCGVITNDSLRITTPDRAYALSSVYDYGIQWSLAIGAQPVEIPSWAYYYSIVTTNSLRASFFMQARAGDIVYATKDADGNYVFTSTTYADTNFGVALKLDILNGYGMGYSFQSGDIIKVYIESGSTIYTLAILDQASNWVIAELVDLGSLSATNAFFEIYTPRPQSAAEIFYEVGQIFNVLDPGTAARRYGTTSGFLPGDVYLLERGTSPGEYLTENMSPSKTFWSNWFTNAGRTQVIVSIGQRFKQTSVKWSNTFIPGTITNGLSAFDSLDEKILPGELGPLRKLLITSKVNNELGAVMLAICEQETASLYLGEQQLVGSSANAFIAQATDVIGTVNPLKGSYGTINPESVTEFRGNAFWIDILNGKIIQYSASGLFPISNYKMTRFWKLFSDQFLSMSREEIENLGNRPFVFSTVDPHHEELLISIPRLLATPPKGTLPDYPFINYPFDIYDGQAKTLKYKVDAEPNHWQGAIKFCSEGFITIQNKLFSFKNGQLYQHNSITSQCEFYGVQEKARIMCLSNSIPQVPKSYNNMTIQANMKPDFVYMYNDYPYQQASDLISDDFRSLEGVFYAPIYRNKLIPTSTGYNINGLLTGEKMRAESLKIMLEFDVSERQLEFRFIDLGFSISSGHTTIK